MAIETRIRQPASRRKPVAIDLFCGCGGLTQGLKDAGFRVLAGLDIDPLSIQAYKRNHRRVELWTESISDVSSRTMMRRLGLRRGDLDLLAGCPPCQAFSELRRKQGGRRVRAKEAKDLVFRFIDYVEAMNPKTVMLENVPRLANDYRMKEVRRRLRVAGFEGQPVVLNAADFGVPQRRRRMVYVASRVGAIEVAASSDEATLTVRDAIGHLLVPGESGDPLHDIEERRDPRIRQLISCVPKDGGSRAELSEAFQLECHKNFRGFHDVYGRMAWREVSHTITGGCINPSKGRFLHPDQDRAITLREAALLQGFPDDYFFPLDRGKYRTAQLIGNAFPPPFARFHASAIHRRLMATIRMLVRSRSVAVRSFINASSGESVGRSASLSSVTQGELRPQPKRGPGA